MKITLTFATSAITAEKFDSVWCLKDTMAGSVHGTLDWCMEELEKNRKRLVKNQLQILVDRLYTTDLTHITKPTAMTDSDDITFAWIVPQGNRWVVIPLCLPDWMSTPMCGDSQADITSMWRQWMDDPLPSPDLKKVKELLSKF